MPIVRKINATNESTVKVKGKRGKPKATYTAWCVSYDIVDKSKKVIGKNSFTTTINPDSDDCSITIPNAINISVKRVNLPVNE